VLKTIKYKARYSLPAHVSSSMWMP